MIKYYMPSDGGVKEARKKDLKSSRRVWIDVYSPNEAELEEVSKLAKIPVTDLKMTLDEEERPRIDISKNYTMIIFRAPFAKEEKEIETSPIGIFLAKKYFITIHPFYTGYVRPVFEPSKKMPIISNSEFLVHILSEILKSYFVVMRKIEKQIDVIEDEVVKDPKKMTIEKIANIKRTLIYFHRSLIANRVVVLHLIEKNVQFVDRKFIESFKDIHTEVFQLLEMTVTYRDLLKGSMDAYSSMISNRVGEVVKILTIITALLTIPLLLTSIYGMNISLPLESSPQAFSIIIAITVLAMMGTWIMFKLKKWI